MQRNIIRSLFILAIPALLAVTGCSKKFEQYSQNQNLPTVVPPGLVLRSNLNGLVVTPGGFEDKADQFIASNLSLIHI